MNVVKPPKPKITFKRKVIYGTFIFVCIIAIAVAVYMQFFQEEKLGAILGVNKLIPSDSAEYEKLKAGFDGLFDNSLKKQENQQENVKKIDSSKDIVFTGYSNVLQEEGKYHLTVNIPYINIDQEKTKQYNQEIQNVFAQKANSIINNNSKNTIYTIDYSAAISDNILSIMIRSNLKEGNSVQRVIIQTYHYDIMQNREVGVQELLEKKGIQEQVANTKIQEEIKIVQSQVEELGALGYSIYARNSQDPMYEMKNITQYFLSKDNHLYIIFPYGNDNFTSEVDLVIF